MLYMFYTGPMFLLLSLENEDVWKLSECVEIVGIVGHHSVLRG